MSDTKAIGFGTTLTNSLLNEDSFLYAHLVKFEKVPNITATGTFSEKASDYSYITDASFNISYNDSTKDVSGTSNGSQVYVANRLKSVSNISETTEAKVSNVTLSVSSISLNTEFVGASANRITISNSDTAGCTIDMVDTTANESWTALGFSEGDQIKIASGDANNGKSVVISRFENNNYRAICIHPSAATTNVFSVNDYTISLDSDEITAVLDDPTDSSYNGYINREVTVYKAHINPDTGAIIGAPYMIFKGIISKAKLTDDPTKGSTVSWTLTSHWGDFVRVNGRMTSDSEHRALGTNGKPDMAALHRDDYVHDYGFMHGEQAVNIIAIYQVQETRYKLKKSGLFGLKTRMKEYQVTVDRDVDLRLNLEAKRLPVIYGVQRVDSIPVFADSLHADPAKIYVAYAICEGEVSGIYDIYVDDQSRICIDKNDSDTRSVQTKDATIDVLCEGRMDKGDTLSSAASVRASTFRGVPRAPSNFDFFGGGLYSGNNLWLDNLVYNVSNIASSTSPNSATGITHGRQTTLQYPLKSKLVFHSGRTHQRADDTLTNIAKAGAENTANGFKLQADTEKPEEYWSQNHRMLDTAYVVAEYEIAEGDVTIPSLDFVVRGREIEQYNYDYSYEEYPSPSFSSGTISDKRALFKVGDTVDFYKLSDESALTQDARIIDASTYLNGRNESVHKFKFDKDPVTTTGTTAFYMVQNGVAASSDNNYPMITWDYKANSGIVPSALTQAVTETVGDGSATIQNTGTGGGTGVDFTELAEKIQALLAAMGTGLQVGFVVEGQTLADSITEFLQAQANPTTTGGATKDNNQANTQASKENVEHYAVLNAIQLADSASDVNDYYNGQFITVVNIDSVTGAEKRQSREIIDYLGSEKIAIVGALIEVQPDETTRAGTHTVLETSWNNYVNPKTLVLDNVTNLSVGDFLTASSDNLATIESGTKITAINGNTITVDKFVIVKQTAVISFLNDGGGALTTTKEPAAFDFIPQANDTYEISSRGDLKASINPAIQLLDYLTNSRFGRGLSVKKDINLETFKESARLCDTRSDVSLILPSSGTYTVGDEWKFVSTVSGTDYLQWQGEISKVIDANSGFKEVTFTKCIGKIIHKWFDWKSYEVGNYVYHKVGAVNKIYKVISAGVISEPSGGNATTFPITKVGTSTTVQAHGADANGISESLSGEKDNPIVKSFTGISATKFNYEKSGYSLYDSDDVKYWRYMGWQEHNQREVTRHQTNAVIRTETPLFNNVNSMLEHFNGILRYSGGKYELDVESTAPTISTGDVRLIDQDDIIGAITVDDAGLKGSANTVSVSISDPNIRYDERGVTFFKSKYLKEDRNIPKKKDVKTPLITNYFNARINAEQYLDQSRFSRKINFVMGPKGVLLLAGTIVKISYERFGWVNKQFRISNLTYRPDCSVQVTAQEHNDDTYIVTAKEKNYQAAGPISPPGDETVAPKAPVNLTATGAAAIATATVSGGAVTAFTIVNGGGGYDSAPAVTISHASGTGAAGTAVVTNGAITAINVTAGGSGYDSAPTVEVAVSSPRADNKITLAWVNTLNFGNPTAAGGASAGWSTEVFVNNHATFTNKTSGTPFADGAYRIHTSAGEETWEHVLPDIISDTTMYYWIRHVKTVTKPNSQRVKLFSPFNPVNTGNGVAGVAGALPVTSIADVFLYKVGDNVSATDLSGDTHFPILNVTMDHGTSHGTITGVKSGQSSAAITNNQVIGTDGGATGWYTTSQSVSSSAKNLYRVSKHISVQSSTTNVEVAKADWTPPVVQGSFGADGTAGKVVKLTATKYVIPYTESNTENTTIVFTATPQNVEGTATFNFLDATDPDNLVQKQAASSSATFTLADNDEPANSEQKVIKVNLFDDGTLVASDSVSVFGIKDGTDAITIILSNDNHSLPASDTGVVNDATGYAGSGTDIRVFKGATALPHAGSGNSTFSVTAAGTDITAGNISTISTYTAQVGPHSAMTGNETLAKVTYTITVRNSTGVATAFTRIQSLNKTNAGADSTTPGDPGLRTVQGYLYYESTGTSAPAKPTGNTYTFNTGKVTGSGIDEGGTTNCWKNTPNEQNPASTTTQWTIRYFGTETSANASNIAVTYSTDNGVKYTNFTGVVTFTGGTFKQNGLEVYNQTTIDGAHITTGTVKGAGYDVSNEGGAALVVATAGLSSGQAVFDVKKSDRTSVFTITKAGDITASNFAFNSGTIAGGVTIGTGGPALSTAQTNTSAKTDGTVGGWTINDTSIVGGSEATGIILETNGSGTGKKRIRITNSSVNRVIIGDLS